MTQPSGQPPYPSGPQPGYGAPGGAPPGYQYPPQPAAPVTGAMAKPRRTNSKAFPVIVASGLAVGVFGGLLLVRGTGTAEADKDNKGTVSKLDETGKTEGTAADGVAPDGAKPEGTAADGAKPEGTAPDGAKPEGTAPDGAKPEGAAADGAAPDGTKPDPADAEPEQPAKPETATLTFSVKPSDLDGVTIEVDGEEVAGDSVEVELKDGSKRVKVVAKTSERGYRPFVKRIKVTKDETVAITIRKRSKPSGHKTPKNPKGPGGLIDLGSSRR